MSRPPEDICITSAFVDRYPIWSFIILCFAITWGVWFTIPVFAGDNWTLIKVLTGVGVGPGLAAVLLDRIRNGVVRWGSGAWTGFSVVFAIVVAIDFWSLIGGDAISAKELAAVEPPGLSVIGTIGTLLAAGIAGFVFASASVSRSHTLSSITTLRAPVIWWLVALFLPAAIFLLGMGVAAVLGSEIPAYPLAETEIRVWAPFLLRAVLFIFLVVTIGEEAGWRGYLLPELQKRFSPLIASVLLGITWGVWHFPLFINGLYEGGPAGIVMQTVLTLVLAVMFTWLFNRTGGILLLMLVLHTALNNTTRILPGTDHAGIALIVFAVVLIFTERMWRRQSRGV